MNHRKHKLVTILLIGLISMVACKTSENNTLNKQAEANIPTTYPENVTTTDSLKVVGWQSYFKQDAVLTDLIKVALDNNQDLQAAIQRIEAAKATLRYHKGQMFPFLTGSATVGQRRFGKYTMDGVGNYDTQFSSFITEDQIIPEHLPDYYGGFQTSWEIDVWGKLRNKKRAAYTRYLASIEGQNWVKTNLIATVATIYYEILSLDKKLLILQETIELQEKALLTIQIQKNTGYANEMAVKQFEALIFNYRANKITLEQELAEKENELNFLLGRYPQKIERDSNEFDEEFSIDVNAGIPSDLLVRRPDIKQASYQLLASSSDVKSAQAALYPSLMLNAGLGLQTFNADFLFSPQSLTYNVLGGLVGPIINRSAVKSDIKFSKAMQQEAMFNYQKTIINAFKEVYDQLLLIDNLSKIHELKNQEAETRNQLIEASSILFLSGQATYLEVLITQEGALNAQLDLIRIKKNQHIAGVNMYKALGGG